MRLEIMRRVRVHPEDARHERRSLEPETMEHELMRPDRIRLEFMGPVLCVQTDFNSQKNSNSITAGGNQGSGG